MSALFFPERTKSAHHNASPGGPRCLCDHRKPRMTLACFIAASAVLIQLVVPAAALALRDRTPCALLTRREIAVLLGSTVTVTLHKSESCGWASRIDDPRAVMVFIEILKLNTKQLKAGRAKIEQETGAQEIAGLGRVVVFRVNSISKRVSESILTIFEAHKVLILHASIDGRAAAEQKVLTMARRIVRRLGSA